MNNDILTIDDVKQLISQALRNSFEKKIGDTPTDDLQLANKKYVDTHIGAAYGGLVNIGGTAGTPFPSGWTSVKNITGVYTITHNLGTTNYSVVATNSASFSNVCAIQTIGTNSFVVDTYNNTSGASWPNTDTPFYFVLVVQN